MIGTVIEGGFNVNYGKTGNDSFVQGLAHSFFARINELFRNNASSDGINEFKTGAALLRLNSQPNMAVLTASSRLAYIFSFGLCHACNGFFVSDLRAADIYANAKFSFHSVNDYLQMEFSHSGYDRFRCFLISSYPKGRIFIRKFS